MTPEEIKALLLSGEEDGADRASIYDKVVSDISETAKKYTDLDAKIKEYEDKIQGLNDKLTGLTETNLKLLDKIKYTSTDEGGDEGSNDEPEVEIADLTSWYEED